MKIKILSHLQSIQTITNTINKSNKSTQTYGNKQNTILQEHTHKQNKNKEKKKRALPNSVKQKLEPLKS